MEETKKKKREDGVVVVCPLSMGEGGLQQSIECQLPGELRERRMSHHHTAFTKKEKNGKIIYTDKDTLDNPLVCVLFRSSLLSRGA